MKKRISIIWAQSDSNAQPSDLESDALPLRHRPDDLAPTHNQYGDWYEDVLTIEFGDVLYMMIAMP